MQVLKLIASVFLLYFSTQGITEAIVSLLQRKNNQSFMLTLFVTGFCLSLPEFVVSLMAMQKGLVVLSLGSLVGVNVYSLFFILGCCGFLSQFDFQNKQSKHLLCFLLVAFVLAGASLWYGHLDWIISVLLLFVYIIFLYLTGKALKEGKFTFENNLMMETPVSKLKLMGIFILSLGAIYLAAFWLLDFAQNFGGEAELTPYLNAFAFVALGPAFVKIAPALMAAWQRKNTIFISQSLFISLIFNCLFLIATLSFFDITFERKTLIEFAAMILALVYIFMLNILEKRFHIKSGLLFLFVFLLLMVYAAASSGL